MGEVAIACDDVSCLTKMLNYTSDVHDCESDFVCTGHERTPHLRAGENTVGHNDFSLFSRP